LCQKQDYEQQTALCCQKVQPKSSLLVILNTQHVASAELYIYTHDTLAAKGWAAVL